MAPSIPRTPEEAAAAKRYYEQAIETIRAAARGCGYAIGVHGSLERDVDLIAVPWVEHAASAERLVEAVKTAMMVATGVQWIHVSEARNKPHGRVGWTLMFVTFNGPHTYIDLAVLPLREQQPLATFADIGYGEE